jgi:hypothetical protein
MAYLPSSIERPVFIVSAPRSGSTLLFETLAKAETLWSVGDESHLLIEGMPRLSVSPEGVDSNRLTEANADPITAQQIRVRFAERLINRDGVARWGRATGPVRMLEKTPKNSLRIPFFRTVFPDALFVYLYRDPRENLSSIMEAWKAGGWITYPRLAGWEGPWSLLLPPGYQELRGKSLAQIAAFQWISANQYILSDLALLPKSRWIMVGYDQLVENAAREVERICKFIDIAFDAQLQTVVGGDLPLSRYTLTPPAKHKWRKNGPAIATVLDQVLPPYRLILETALPAEVAAEKIEAFKNVPLRVGRNEPCPCGSAKRYKECHGALA